MPDIIEKTITVKAAIERVWQALTDYREFGAWFRVDLKEPFVLGQVTTGVTTYPGYEGWPFWARVVTMQKPSLFVLDWPWSPDAKPEVAEMPGQTTRVTFTLDPEGSSTRIHLTETGFGKIPEDKRAEKYRSNDGGWTTQMENIRAHVEQ